jgi:sporulation-control protein spo0M
MDIGRALISSIFDKDLVVHTAPLMIAIFITAECLTFKLAVVRCGCHAYLLLENPNNIGLINI